MLWVKDLYHFPVSLQTQVEKRLFYSIFSSSLCKVLVTWNETHPIAYVTPTPTGITLRTLLTVVKVEIFFSFLCVFCFFYKGLRYGENVTAMFVSDDCTVSDWRLLRHHCRSLLVHSWIILWQQDEIFQNYILKERVYGVEGQPQTARYAV